MGCKQLQLNDYFRFVGNESDIQYSERQHRKDRPTGFSFTYDGLSRLTKEVSECADKAELDYTSEYTYDLVGNRLKHTFVSLVPFVVDYSYNNNDQLTLESNSVKGDTVYSYDANGSMIGKVNDTQNESYLYAYKKFGDRLIILSSFTSYFFVNY
jgi:YD repeat-containing protein